MVPTPISDDKREQTIEAVHAGGSRSDIAQQVGVSRGTVTSAATTIRHTFGRANLAHAHEVRSAYSAERRAEIAKRLIEDADRLLDGLNGEYPGVRLRRSGQHLRGAHAHRAIDRGEAGLLQTIRDAMRTVLDIARHDNRTPRARAPSTTERRGAVQGGTGRLTSPPAVATSSR